MDTEELPQWKRELPPVQHKLFNDLLDVLVEFYKEHIRRDIDAGRLNPADPWVMLRGFLMAAMQTYASICILLADKRPKPLMLQAGILNRSLIEILATVVALTEDLSARAQILDRESYKSLADLEKRFKSDPKWTDDLEACRRILAGMPEKIGLPPELAQNPDAIQDKWPTPGVMVHGRPNRNVPPFVSGTRLAVLKKIYDYHYPLLSAQAHGRIASMATAMSVDDPSLQSDPVYSKTCIIFTAILFMACILSEIESLGGYSQHQKLAELWTYLRKMDGEAKELWDLRYEELSSRAKGR